MASLFSSPQRPRIIAPAPLSTERLEAEAEAAAARARAEARRRSGRASTILTGPGGASLGVGQVAVRSLLGS
jgi:hypothetical protein